MCLVVGGPPEWVDTLSVGPFGVTKGVRPNDDDYKRLMTDLYPPHVCMQASMCFAEAYSVNKSWPISEPRHVMLLQDVLTGIPDKDVEHLIQSTLEDE